MHMRIDKAGQDAQASDINDSCLCGDIGRGGRPDRFYYRIFDNDNGVRNRYTTITVDKRGAYQRKRLSRPDRIGTAVKQ